MRREAAGKALIRAIRLIKEITEAEAMMRRAPDLSLKLNDREEVKLP